MALVTDKALLNRASSGLLREVTEDFGEDRRAITAAKLRICLDLEREKRLSNCPTAFHARTSLHEVFLDAAEYLSIEEVEGWGFAFPPPPIPDIPEIQALRTPEDVYEEACTQGNCVWHLLPRLASGRLFLYRMLAPERATLSIRPHGDTWRIDELEAAWNMPVSNESEEFAQKWLTGMTHVAVDNLFGHFPEGL